MATIVQILMISLCIFANSQSKETNPLDFFSLKASSTWREFASNPSQRCKKTNDKRILIGEIKLKSKEIMFLEELKASWCGGTNIGKMVASLYSKKITDRRSPIPIDDNLICDGTWNPTAKEFVFPINKKLVASDTYYLMLHVPKKFESQLKMGSFKIQGHKQCALLSFKKAE